MKKVFLTVIAAALIAVSASAQLFVGGSVNFNTYSGSDKANGVSVDTTSNYKFGVSPLVGYELNDEMSVGAEVTLAFSGSNNNQSPETTSSGTYFGIAPFLRYNVLEIGNVTIFGHAYMGLGFGSSSFKRNGNSVDGPSSFAFGIGVIPYASYKIADRISIEASVGRLGFTTVSTKQTIGNSEIKSTRNSFDLDLISTDLKIGFTYSF